MRPLVFGALLLALLAAPAQATTVAYLDGDAVWLASPDGTQRKQLSGPAGDGREWRELTQSDNGRVLAVRREPGKIFPLNSFTLWGPDGATLYQGALTGQPGWTSYVYPLTLELTPDGRNVVYGFSNSRGFYPTMQFDKGAYVHYADRAPASEPFRIPEQTWPTTAGPRIISAAGTQIMLQRAGEPAPYGLEFDPWLDVGGTGLELHRTDVAANGAMVAIELVAWDGGSQTQGKVAMIAIDGLGGATRPGDCYLPAQGLARDVSLSQDATLVAWRDDRGVVVAGVPDFSGSEPCTLTQPPVVISAIGTMPALGPATIPAAGPPDGGGPAGPGGGGGPKGAGAAPKPKLAKRVKAKALRAGVPVKVTVAAAGKVAIVGKVGGKVVARGMKRAAGAGTVRVLVRATRKGLGRLAGKTLVLRVTAGGRSATVTRKLR